MKNKDIITLGNAGFFAATAHTMPVEQFYKVIRWRRDLQKAYAEIARTEGEFLREAGLTFDDLQNPDADPKKMERYGALNAALLDEESKVVARRIPARYYKYLYDENADLFTNTEVEDIVLDNLFTEDEEDE